MQPALRAPGAPTTRSGRPSPSSSPKTRERPRVLYDSFAARIAAGSGLHSTRGLTGKN